MFLAFHNDILSTMIVFNVPRRFYSISQVPQAAMTYKLIFYIDWLSSLLLPESLQVKEAQFVKLIGFIPNPISSSMNTHRRGSCTIFFIIDGTNKVERIRNYDPRQRGLGRKEVVRLRWLCLCQTNRERGNQC
jgi:hypothetical protein